MEYCDHYGIHDCDGLLEEEDEEPKKEELKDGGYLFNRNEDKAYLRWRATLPMEMQHYQMMQIPEYRIAHHPVSKIMNKIRITSHLFSHNTPKDLTKSSARFDGEETTARSMSSASKVYEIKSGLRKPLASEESGIDGLTSMVSQKPLFESRRSLISSPSQRLNSDGNFGGDTQFQFTATSSSGNMIEKPKKAKKPAVVFNSEFKPAILTSTECSNFLSSLEEKR